MTDDVIYCTDERHNVPCLATCSPCQDECDPAARMDETEARAAYPGWTPQLSPVPAAQL